LFSARSAPAVHTDRKQELLIQGAFNVTKADWRKAAPGRGRTMDQYLDLLGLPSGGALRASVGLASNVEDLERFLAFVEMTYRDHLVDTTGLTPRLAC